MSKEPGQLACEAFNEVWNEHYFEIDPWEEQNAFDHEGWAAAEAAVRADERARIAQPDAAKVERVARAIAEWTENKPWDELPAIRRSDCDRAARAALTAQEQT